MRRFTDSSFLSLLLLFAVACSSGGGNPRVDTFEIVPLDVVLFGPQDNVVSPDRWEPDARFEADSDADDLTTPLLDSFADVSVPEVVAPETVADVPLVDQPGELDSTVSPDIPDVVIDTGFVDAGMCGECPVQTPVCQNGVCVCNGASCGLAAYCKGGDCVPCNVDLHCGPACESCGAQGKWCAADGSGCVKCDDVSHFCLPGEACIDGNCVNCEGLGFCGPDCIKCSEKVPDCVAGACVCNSESCGVSHVCEGGACVECTPLDAAHCGADCLVCTGGAPHCLDGACALCNTNEQCGPSCQPCNGKLCAPGAAGCVECLVDGDCAAGFVCDDAWHCIPDCVAPGGCANDLSPSGKKCSEAKVVGRPQAASTAHFTGDTYSQGNDDDLNYFLEHSECWDASYDHFYRMYLFPQETLTVSLVPKEAQFDAMLKLYTGTECDDDSAGIFSANDKYLIQCWNDDGDGDPEGFAYTVTAEGWHTIVVDGRQSGEEDWGEYELDVTLSCSTDNCCCP